MSHVPPRASSLQFLLSFPEERSADCRSGTGAFNATSSRSGGKRHGSLDSHPYIHSFSLLFSVTNECNDDPDFTPDFYYFRKLAVGFLPFKRIRLDGLHSQTHDDVMADHVISRSKNRKSAEEVV